MLSSSLDPFGVWGLVGRTLVTENVLKVGITIVLSGPATEWCLGLAWPNNFILGGHRVRAYPS